MKFLGTWLVDAIACAFAIWMVPGITAIGGDWAAPIFCALALSLLNATVRPLLQALSLPITVISLGIFHLVINAVVLEMASALSRNVFHAGIAIESFGAAFLGAIVISVVSMLVGGIVGAD